MPLVLANGVRFSIIGGWSNGRPVVTTWHTITVTAGSRPPACLEVAGMIAGAWETHCLPLLPNNYKFQEVRWLDLATTTGSSGSFSLPTVSTGGQIASVNSPYTGIVVTKLIADKGRGRRSGRLFLPGLNELAADEDGIISDAARNGAQAALEAFRSQVNGYTSAVVSANRLVVAHTPFVEVAVPAKTVRQAAKDGNMTSSDITGFVCGPLESGIRARIAG